VVCAAVAALTDAHTRSTPRIPRHAQRNAKKLSQKELAQQCMISAGIINDYEAGRAIPDGALISKFERVLGVRLPRPKKK
jgi:ribosome-binding protein aMBF1 (putative translation factor)